MVLKLLKFNRLWKMFIQDFAVFVIPKQEQLAAWRPVFQCDVFRFFTSHVLFIASFCMLPIKETLFSSSIRADMVFTQLN